ncbi:MAG: c-diamide synthase [Candidatus Tokpelaia sp. JSC189]|nr:MAG: c-diamide synthase [Candidatus Tokpelaia sp. JSC189]
MKGFMLASSSSGAGKTLVMLSLLRVLKNRGIDLAPAKVGPDYIDPAFHQAACGVESINLDAWAMRPSFIEDLVADIIQDGVMLVVEAMMGLFDGATDGTYSCRLAQLWRC